MSRCLAAAIAAAGALVVRAGTLQIQLPPETNSFKQDVGAELANAQCLICHSVEYVSTQPPLPRASWKSSVQKMQQKYGAVIPEEQVEPLVDYLTRNYGAAVNGLPASPRAAQTQTQQSSSAGGTTSDGPRVAAQYGCLGCHNASARIVGPSYREIATKYKTDPKAAEKIEQQIHKGGSGKWGPIIMPPFPQVTSGETKLLTEWILGLK